MNLNRDRSMNHRMLSILLLLNGVSTSLHYTDNYCFIDRYPQPGWITAASIYESWLLLTAVGVAGYFLYQRQKGWAAYFCLAIYSLTGLSSLGHYFYGARADFSLKMHGLILLDGIAGLLLLGFVLWSALVQREWQPLSANQPITNTDVRTETKP